MCRRAFALVLLAGCVGGPAESPWASAARSAGFRVLELKADLPVPARSRIPYLPIPYDDPRLAALREKYALEKVVAGARDEWTAQLLLRDWIHRAIPDGTPKVKVRRAEEILDAAARGETFWCTYYAISYLECALALGWACRKIAVDRRHGPEGLESTHHGLVEVWSSQFRKWAAIDPQSNMHFEKAGVPLSAWEIRAEWLRNRGAEVDHLVGPPSKLERRNPGIRWWDRRGEDETAAYFWLYIIDRADVSDPAARFIFPQDEANDGLIWYQNDDASKRSRLHQGYQRGLFIPTRRIEDAYWTVGIVEVRIVAAEPGALVLGLESEGLDRAGYEVSTDGRAWHRVANDRSVRWDLTPGWNSFRVHALGRGGWPGPQSAVLLFLESAR